MFFAFCAIFCVKSQELQLLHLFFWKVGISVLCTHVLPHQRQPRSTAYHGLAIWWKWMTRSAAVDVVGGSRVKVHVSVHLAFDGFFLETRLAGWSCRKWMASMVLTWWSQHILRMMVVRQWLSQTSVDARIWHDRISHTMSYVRIGLWLVFNIDFVVDTCVCIVNICFFQFSNSVRDSAMFIIPMTILMIITKPLSVTLPKFDTQRRRGSAQYPPVPPGGWAESCHTSQSSKWYCMMICTNMLTIPAIVFCSA